MGMRLGRMGPVHLVLRWMLRALGFGFVLGAATGLRVARQGGGDVGAHHMADRVEHAMRVLAGRDADTGGAGKDAEASPQA